MKFILDGKEIFDMKPIYLEYKPESKIIENGDNLNFYNREYQGTLNNITIDKDFINQLSTDQLYTVVMEEKNFPRGNRLPKKKRIRKKWLKKYVRAIELENCEII